MTTPLAPNLADIRKQLSNAHAVLASVLDINRREGIFNEHVLRSETVAQNLVNKLEKDIVMLSSSSEKNKAKTCTKALMIF
jgi:hypothetical protein